MTQQIFSDKSTNDNSIVLPQAPQMTADTAQEYEVYRKFIGHLRLVPISRPEIKVLSAIQFTADMMDLSDAHVSKMLVEMGLRAPRLAFPMEFLDYVDAALMRRGWSVGAPSEGMIALQGLWFSMQKESSGLSFRHVHSVLEEEYAKV